MADPDFSASSSRGQALALTDFRGKVPVVLVFVGPLDPSSDAVADLDRHHVDFGHERVQLLVVAQADGAEVREVPSSGVELPVLADPDGELRATYARGKGAEAFAVVLDTEGELVARFALDGGAEALLVRVRDLGDTLHA